MSEGAAQEMTLDQWCERLPSHHRVNIELRALREAVVTPAPEERARELLKMLADTPPIQRWKEYEERGEQRIPCYIQVETAQAIAEFFSEPPMNSGPLTKEK